MEVVIRIYLDVIMAVIKKRDFTVYVHPVLPVLNETRTVVKQFNTILSREVQRKAATTPQLRWLPFFSNLLTPDREQLRREFEFDGTHMSPRYLPLLARALEGVIPAAEP